MENEQSFQDYVCGEGIQIMNEEIKELLKQHNVRYNAKKDIWCIDGKKTSKDVIKGLDFLNKFSGLEIIQSLDAIQNEVNSTNVKPVDAPKYFSELFLEDIQRPIDDRELVPRTIEQMVIDNAMIDKPYFKRMKGESIDELKLGDYFKLTVRMNPHIFNISQSGYNVETLVDMFKNYLEGKYLDYRYEIYQNIKYDPQYEQQADEFLHKLYDFYKPSFVTVNEIPYYSYELFAAIIKHSIWCVKNKLAFGECNYPIFVSIEGDQGCGKSEFTRHLGRDLLGKLYAEVKTDQLNDNFAQGLWNKKIFCNFEDMDKEDTVGNGRIKRIITQKEILHRGMRVEEFHETPNKATFFGTSNYAIWEIFPDKTGMRRYADLKFTRDDMKNDLIAQMYCDKIWKENRLALWKGVDEHKTMGYVFGNAMADLLDLARTTYVSSNDTVKKWLDKNDLKVVSIGCSGGKTVKEAYDDYVSYTDEKLTCSFSNFCKRIQSLYTGKVKLKSSKLKVVNKVIAENDNAIPTVELNPFEQYLTFTPFEEGEKWRNELQNAEEIPQIPQIPHDSTDKCEKNKNDFEVKNMGNMGNMGNFSCNSNKDNDLQIPHPGEYAGISHNKLDDYIQAHNRRSKSFELDEKYHNPNWMKEELVQNDDFFKRIQEQESDDK